uniref:H/ACA ribonucleoprotein complex subunit 2 n=1 Tax=Oxyrrhis marina TaxID=2969 RepID=A0A7S3UNS0_OXYMA|mmetsp:Transcript_612/g.969  ORF Transcript_612/g.969 Transcript_612/m.969 type:complete len:131 (+) Transcript_612:2-394(+)
MPAWISPMADPLIGDKLLSRSLKLIKKAKEEKSLRRGVPETCKALRKDQKGLVFLAADVFPLDVMAHVPVCCEEKDVAYAYVPSRTLLGKACQSGRPASVLMVMAPKKDSTYAKTYEQVEKGMRQVHPYM